MTKASVDSEEVSEVGASLHYEEADPQAQPLQDLSTVATTHEVERFAESYNLLHKIDVLERASTLIQGDLPFAQIPGITNEEIQALQSESNRKWRQPVTLYLTIVVCSLGAIGQGWAQTSMNGANLYFPRAFGIDSGSSRDNLIVGLINSALYLSVGLGGAWLSDPVNNRIGRRGATFAASSLSLMANAGAALAGSWKVLLLFRLLLGLGLGTIVATVNVYAAECAPSSIRGGLAVSWQMFTALGIFVSFVANASVYDYGPNTWRLQLAAPLVPHIPLLMVVYLCPESPSYLLKSGQRYDRALASLTRLRNTELQAARELYATYLQQSSRLKSELRTSLVTRFIELFTIPRIRRAMMGSYTVVLSQQLCGINIIAFYSSTIFSNAGFSTFGALVASCVFGLINFVGAFPAVWTMDSLGRRSLLLLTLPFMALTMFAAGLSFSIPSGNSAHFVLLATMIYLFCAEYSPGVGPVPVAYSAEVFPLSHREVGMSMAIASANIWAAILSLTFPQLLAWLGSQGAFSLYAALNVLALILVFLFVPETRLKTLDELDEVFSVPSRDYVKYQVTEWLPWFWRRYMLRQKSAELRSMVAIEQYRQLEQDEEDEM